MRCGTLQRILAYLAEEAAAVGVGRASGPPDSMGTSPPSGPTTIDSRHPSPDARSGGEVDEHLHDRAAAEGLLHAFLEGATTIRQHYEAAPGK
jgi:hypothetical protein